MMGLTVPGATDAADEVTGPLRYRQPLRKGETAGIDVEMARRSPAAAVDLQEPALANEVADRHRLNAERLRLAAAAGPVLIALKLDQLGQAGDQSSDFLSL